jgi:predicted dehydrogenase
MMNKIRVAVVGVGHLGYFHVQKYAKLPQATLIGVCDVDKERVQKIAHEYEIKAFSDYRQLLQKVDAVIIATPTSSHYEIAAFFLSHQVHVLLEKPITTTIIEADKLIGLSKNNDVILQIGHLERFNSVIQAAKPFLHSPLFIESVRIAPFKPRGMDINVILDLMIHDIDIIQYLMGHKINRIWANGAKVVTDHVDIGNARLEFKHGGVANITASRVSLKSQRVLRVFQHNAYISLDLQNKRLAVHKKGEADMFPGIPEIVYDEIDCPSNDALEDQALAFLSAVISNQPPLVSGQVGRDALFYALQITENLKQHNERYVDQWIR